MADRPRSAPTLPTPGQLQAFVSSSSAEADGNSAAPAATDDCPSSPSSSQPLASALPDLEAILPSGAAAVLADTTLSAAQRRHKLQNLRTIDLQDVVSHSGRWVLVVMVPIGHHELENMVVRTCTASRGWVEGWGSSA